MTWSLSPRDVNGLFAGIQIGYQCSFNGYRNDSVSGEGEHVRVMHSCDNKYYYVSSSVQNKTEYVITNLMRFYSLYLLASTLFLYIELVSCFSYSRYNVFVYAVSLDSSLGFQYLSGWMSNVVLTAENSKAILYKYQYVIFNY